MGSIETDSETGMFGLSVTPKKLPLDEAVATLKFKRGQLTMLRMLNPTSRETAILRELFSIIDGLEVPERMDMQ